MKQSYLLTIHQKTSLSSYELVQFFNQYDIQLSLERELSKTQGHFPMSFSGKLLKDKSIASWNSSFEIYPYKDTEKELENDDFRLIINTYDDYDELSFAYLCFYLNKQGCLITYQDKQMPIDIDEKILYAEKQYLDKSKDKNTPTPLVENYYVQSNSTEQLVNKVIQRIEQTQKSKTPLSDLNVIIHSSDFNQVKDLDVFLEKLVTFLDENQLNKEALVLLRSVLYPNKKKFKISTLMIILLIVGFILSIFVYISSETLSSFLGCLFAVFGIIPFYLLLKKYLPKLPDVLKSLFSSYLIFGTFMVIAIISEIFFILSYELYDFLISIVAMSMIQSVCATILAIIYALIILIKKAISY